MKGTDEQLMAHCEKLRDVIRSDKIELQDWEDKLRQTELELERRRERAIEELTGVRAYGSDDYWGLCVGRYKFYYGYERTMCLKHTDCSCEDKEWCFTAEVDNEEIMRIPKSRLGQDRGVWNLLHGIGQFLTKLEENQDK